MGYPIMHPKLVEEEGNESQDMVFFQYAWLSGLITMLIGTSLILVGAFHKVRC